MNQKSFKKRVLAIAPSARGFGYCLMEGGAMIEWGYKGVDGNKNVHAMAKVGRLMKHYSPDGIVLQDINATVKGCSRYPRIKILHRKMAELAAKRKCQIALISGESLRILLTGNAKGTKQQMAEILALKFPELAAKLPPKRCIWQSENCRMDLFDAVGLAAVYWMSLDL